MHWPSLPRWKTPSLLNRSAPYFSGIQRFGLNKFSHYWQDPFHTLLNLPWPRFIFIFFFTYVIEFLVFALIFYAMSDKCIIGMDGKFAHALWMSSRTASTLGFDQIHPNPECIFTNLTIMLQVIASSLVNFIMLGLVFARFSAPFKRATTIRFSSVMVCNRHPSGNWCLSLRVANIRKHQILKPCVRMVLTAVDSITPSNYLFEHLTIDGLAAQETNLELGFPANVTHVITPSSPLYNLSLLEMDTRMMEILVFVDGIDAMTSKNMSARHAYNTNEVHINEQFLPLHLEMRGRSLGLDFSGFDATALASTELLAEHNADPGMAERPLPEIQSHMWHLRHMTFKRLTDRAEPGQAQAQAPGPNPTVAGLSAGGAGLPVSSGPASAGGFGSAIPRAHVGPLSASASSSGGGGAGIVGGHHIGLSVSSNPFAAPGAAAAAAELPPAAAASGGGGASWMGFGMTLQPQHPPPPSGPMPLSAFLAASGSGLESFADMPSHAQPAGYATTAHHVTHRTWAGSAAGAAAPPSGAATGAAAPLVGAGLGAGAGQGVEMLPTSSAAVEPRGVNGMGSR